MRASAKEILRYVFNRWPEERTEFARVISRVDQTAHIRRRAEVRFRVGAAVAIRHFDIDSRMTRSAGVSINSSGSANAVEDLIQRNLVFLRAHLRVPSSLAL